MQNLSMSDPVTTAALDALARDGFVILPGLADRAALDAVRADLAPCFAAAPFCQGSFYGARTKRFGRLLARTNHAESFVRHPTVLAILDGLFGASTYQLNLSQCIEIHPGAPVQPPHRDHDMWACPKVVGTTHLVNVMWALTEFTSANGGTRIWPGTNCDDWRLHVPGDDGVVEVAASPGSAIIFLGQTLHAGGANRTAEARRGMVFSYCLDWLLPHENPWLAYPPQLARRFSPELAALVGYRQRFGGLNNFEGLCPARLLSGSQAEFNVFTDAMHPEHVALIESYYRDRNAA